MKNGALPELAIARQKKGVSLQDIAATTKISVPYLRAIEEGTFEKLPGGIYTVSYIRQYAQAIDYDDDELLRHYLRLSGAEAPAPGVSAPKRGSGPLGRLVRVLT